MPVTNCSQESCTRNLYKSTCIRNLTVCRALLFVQVLYCTRILHQIEQSSIRHKKLADTWPKLRDVIGWLVCWRNLQTIKKQRQTTQPTKQQSSTINKLTNHISQFWSRVCKFLAWNRAHVPILTACKLWRIKMYDIVPNFITLGKTVVESSQYLHCQVNK